MKDFNLRIEIREFNLSGDRAKHFGWIISIQKPDQSGYAETGREYISKITDCQPTPIEAWESAMAFIELLKTEDKFLPPVAMQTMGYKPPSRPPAQRTEGTGTR